MSDPNPTPSPGQDPTPTPGGGDPDPQPGGGGESWLTSLPEDLQGHEAIKGFESPADLAKAHVEALGKVPAAPPKRYKIGPPPEGHNAPFPVIKAIATGPAKELGLSQEQFTGLEKFTNGYLVKVIVDSRVANKKALQEATKALKDKWGGEYEAKVLAAGAFMTESGLGAVLNKHGLNTHPDFIEIAEALSRHAAETQSGQESALDLRQKYGDAAVERARAVVAAEGGTETLASIEAVIKKCMLQAKRVQ